MVPSMPCHMVCSQRLNIKCHGVQECFFLLLLLFFVVVFVQVVFPLFSVGIFVAFYAFLEGVPIIILIPVSNQGARVS